MSDEGNSVQNELDDLFKVLAPEERKHTMIDKAADLLGATVLLAIAAVVVIGVAWVAKEVLF